MGSEGFADSSYFEEMGLAVTGAPSAMQSKLEIRKPFLQADDSGVRRSWLALMCDGRHNLLASALVPVLEHGLRTDPGNRKCCRCCTRNLLMTSLYIEYWQLP